MSFACHECGTALSSPLCPTCPEPQEPYGGETKVADLFMPTETLLKILRAYGRKNNISVESAGERLRARELAELGEPFINSLYLTSKGRTDVRLALHDCGLTLL